MLHLTEIHSGGIGRDRIALRILSAVIIFAQTASIEDRGVFMGDRRYSPL